MSARRPLSLKIRALQWLAQREHSQAELRTRLLRLAQAPGRDTAEATQASQASQASQAISEVEPLLTWLAERGYLSDQRFVDSRVQVRSQRFGNLRIEAELRRHGLALDPNARAQLQGSELERARALWQRKYGAPAADLAGRLRQMRFLAGRGFSLAVVRQVVQGSGDISEP